MSAADVRVAPDSGSAREALHAAADALAAAGVETPRLDAELLLAEATGRERAELAAHPDSGVNAAAARAFGDMVRRRIRREPVAYIVGRKGFRGLDVAVDPRVLIPRPETELLVEVALEHRPRTVLDVGTGSGAVALAVADELPDARVTATDLSIAALEVARANAGRLGLAERIEFRPGSVPGDARYDLVLANLPYVREDEWEDLAPEIARHEPREALVAGPTGLEATRALVGARVTGVVALEVGAGQSADVAAMMRDAGFGALESRRDLAGIERVVVGSR
jgi:release factor glutamine methyltransferase